MENKNNIKTCDSCNLVFKNKQFLASHIRQIHNKTPYPKPERLDCIKNCKNCTKQFTVSRILRKNIPHISKYEKEFCSRSCANSRKWTEEDKQKISRGLNLTKDVRPETKKLQAEKLMKNLEKINFGRGRKLSNTTKEKISNAHLGKVYSKETLEKFRQAALKREFGGTTSSKKFTFIKNDGEEIKLQSSYEVKFAKILDNLNIEWERPKFFWWIDFENKKHRYYPDFKIGNIYIDTKNDYLAEKDKPKIEAVKIQNKIDLRIVTLKDINENYIKSIINEGVV